MEPGDSLPSLQEGAMESYLKPVKYSALPRVFKITTAECSKLNRTIKQKPQTIHLQTLNISNMQWPIEQIRAALTRPICVMETYDSNLVANTVL